MKVLYIGAADKLSKEILLQFAKEGDEVHIIAPENFKKFHKPACTYKFHTLMENMSNNKKVFDSIQPSVVILGSRDLLLPTWSHETQQKEYLSQLGFWCDLCGENAGLKVIFLSSTDIYGTQHTSNTEAIAPASLKGRTLALGEQLVQYIAHDKGISYTILRCSDIFDFHISEGDTDFLAEMVCALQQGEPIVLSHNPQLQPIHISDVVDGIKRASLLQRDGIYTLCATVAVSKYALYQQLSDICQTETSITCSSSLHAEEESIFDNSTAKSALEWSEHYDIQKDLKESKLVIKKKPTKKIIAATKEAKKQHTELRIFLENIVLFLIAYGFTALCQDHSLFSTVDWMIIYIIVSAVSYGMKGSVYAIIFTIISSIVVDGIFTFSLDSLYFYMNAMLQIAQYIFAGVIIGYAVDTYREDIENMQREHDDLITERDEIEAINFENLSIKKEYEKRLLNAKNSLPTLCGIIEKINVLETDRIFVEILTVISNIMETNTVATYTYHRESPFLRLLTASSPDAIIEGKSWNLSEYPHIQNALNQGEVYVGDKWKNEPAMVAPIMNNGICIAVIAIREMPFEKQNLYQVNLLRTLMILISSAVGKALNYEVRVRKDRYIGDTEILNASEFTNAVALSLEKRDAHIADCCFITCAKQDTYTMDYEKIIVLLRTTDVIGLSSNGQLQVILSNTSMEQGNIVLERITANGIDAILQEEI